MLINGSGRLGGVERRTKTSRAKSGGVFSLGAEPQVSQSTGMAPSQSLQDLNSILSIQEVDSSPSRRQQAFERGEEMLDILQDIKAGLLIGRIPEEKLKRLLHVVKAKVDPGDQQLTNLIQEIELRAEVELAKLALSR